MTAGRLRDRVSFRVRLSDVDDDGNPSEVWADVMDGGQVVTEWADILERLGGERLHAGALSSSRLATIRVRRNSRTVGITAAHLVVARGLVWNIRAVADVGRDRKFIEFTAEHEG